MPKVLCTLPNASDEINGVKFSAIEGGALSEDLTAEQADVFLSIPGYVEHQEDTEADAKVARLAAEESERKAAEAEAKALAAKAAAKAGGAVKPKPVATTVKTLETEDDESKF